MQTPNTAVVGGVGDPSTPQSRTEVEAQIIAEIFDFWQTIPNSPLQALTQQGNYKKAAQQWEARAKRFYSRFAPALAGTETKITWNNKTWSDFRSVQIETRPGWTIAFPKICYGLQGLSQSAYEQFLAYWDREPKKSLQNFVHQVEQFEWRLFGPLTPRELVCIQAACRSLSNPNAGQLGRLKVQTYEEETGFHPALLTKLLGKLYSHRRIYERHFVNFARIGLQPYLFVAQRPLAYHEDAYCFMQVRSEKGPTWFSGIAVPPTALEIGWAEGVRLEGSLEPICSFFTGWNLSQLGSHGWQSHPASLEGQPRQTALGTKQMSFHYAPLSLQPKDPAFLEAIQGCAPRLLRGRFGVHSYRRVQKLRQKKALMWAPRFSGIACYCTIFLFCRATSTVLDKIRTITQHYPRFRVWEGHEWLLAALNLPISWLQPALEQWQTIRERFSLKDFVVERYHSTVERFLRFSELYDAKMNAWIT